MAVTDDNRVCRAPGGGEGVEASGGRGWPEGGGGPGWPPDAGIRDAAARWPPSSGCISSGALTVSARALSVSAPALSVSEGACWPFPSPIVDGAGLASARGPVDGCSWAELLLCATEGAGDERADRAMASVRASAAWDSDCGLSDEYCIISGSAGGECLWSCGAPTWLPGPVGAGPTFENVYPKLQTTKNPRIFDF